jgi:hypothetical protein
MAKRRPARKRAVLGYPSHWFKPEELLTFIELRYFTRRWEQLDLADLDLEALQVVLMLQPKGGDVIEGTGGLRKMRFAPAGSGRGRSGGLRVCYAYVEEVATVVLALVYQKGEKDDLDADEKAALAAAIGQVRQALLSRPYRSRGQPEVEE